MSPLIVVVALVAFVVGIVVGLGFGAGAVYQHTRRLIALARREVPPRDVETLVILDELAYRLARWLDRRA